MSDDSRLNKASAICMAHHTNNNRRIILHLLTSYLLFILPPLLPLKHFELAPFAYRSATILPANILGLIH